MPALVLFGRRARIGSDDLYCPALLLLAYQLPLLVVALSYVAFWRRCATLTLDTHGAPFWFLLGAVPLYGFMACLYLMIARVSAKGTIIEHERRLLMPRVLQTHVVFSALVFAYGVTGLVLWYHTDMCYPDSNFVLVRSLVSGCLCRCTRLTGGWLALGDRSMYGHGSELHAHTRLLHLGWRTVA